MFTFEAGGRTLTFQTSPGVFSADGPDEGSRLLVETVLPHIKPHHKILDLGCGSGFVGIALSTALTSGELYLLDVDIRAIRATENNLKQNGISLGRAVLSDGVADLPPKLRFDAIISNPPTHDGKEVLRGLVSGAHTVLRPGGTLWLVVNRLLSIKDLMSDSFGNVEPAGRHKGFVVFRSQKVRFQRDA